MSTAPVTPVAPKETGVQKFESILAGIGKVLQDSENVIINVGVAEQNVLLQLLPTDISTPLVTALNLAASTFASMEVTEQQVGGSSVPYAQKVATILALQGANIAKVLATAGLDDGQNAIETIIAAATGIATIGKITAAPVPAAPVPTDTALVPQAA